LDAAIFDFPIPVKSYNIYSRFIRQVDLENIDFAFKIVFLCCLQAEIYVFMVKFRCGVRHLDFYFRSARTVFSMFYVDRIFKDLSNDVLQAILFAV